MKARGTLSASSLLKCGSIFLGTHHLEHALSFRNLCASIVGFPKHLTLIPVNVFVLKTLPVLDVRFWCSDYLTSRNILLQLCSKAYAIML